MVRANKATSSDSGTRVTPSSVERRAPHGIRHCVPDWAIQGKTFWGVLHRRLQFYLGARKESHAVLGIQQYVQWVDQFCEFSG